MDINSLHRKRQKNVQEQNFLDRELIRQVAEWWEEGNKLPNPIEEKAKVIGIKRETAILVERGVFPECCPNHHYGCFLKREGVFWAFSIVLNQKEDEIIEIEEWHESNIEVNGHVKGIGKTWGFLCHEILREIKG